MLFAGTHFCSRTGIATGALQRTVPKRSVLVRIFGVGDHDTAMDPLADPRHSDAPVEDLVAAGTLYLSFSPDNLAWYPPQKLSQ